MKKILSLIICLFLTSTLMAKDKNYWRFEGKINNKDTYLDLFSTEDFFSASIYFVDDNIVLQGDCDYSDSKLKIIFEKEDPLKNYGVQEIKSLELEGVFDDSEYRGTCYINSSQSHSFNFKKSKPSFVFVYNSKAIDTLNSSVGINIFEPNDTKIKNSFYKLISEGVCSDYNSYVNKNISEFSKYAPEDLMENNIPYMLYISAVPIVNTKDYIVVVLDSYTYTGGAHGFFSVRNCNYSHKLGKWINENDVFDMKYKEQIAKVIDNEIHKEYNIAEGTKLNEDKNSIFIGDKAEFSYNFLLSKEGVTFYYGLYELTPYTHGIFTIFVPYTALKNYLNKGFVY